MSERQAVLATEEDAWAELVRAVASVPARARPEEGVVPGWSTHDVVWHLAHWAGCGADAVESMAAGAVTPDDDEATDLENAAITHVGRGMTWEEVFDQLEMNRVRSRVAVARFPGDVPERAIEFFVDYTTDHYLEHASQVRSFGMDRSRPEVVS